MCLRLHKGKGECVKIQCPSLCLSCTSSSLCQTCEEDAVMSFNSACVCKVGNVRQRVATVRAALRVMVLIVGPTSLVEGDSACV